MKFLKYQTCDDKYLKTDMTNIFQKLAKITSNAKNAETFNLPSVKV